MKVYNFLNLRDINVSDYAKRLVADGKVDVVTIAFVENNIEKMIKYTIRDYFENGEEDVIIGSKKLFTEFLERKMIPSQKMLDYALEHFGLTDNLVKLAINRITIEMLSLEQLVKVLGDKDLGEVVFKNRDVIEYEKAKELFDRGIISDLTRTQFVRAGLEMIKDMSLDYLYEISGEQKSHFMAAVAGRSHIGEERAFIIDILDKKLKGKDKEIDILAKNVFIMFMSKNAFTREEIDRYIDFVVNSEQIGCILTFISTQDLNHCVDKLKPLLDETKEGNMGAAYAKALFCNKSMKASSLKKLIGCKSVLPSLRNVCSQVVLLDVMQNMF